MFPNAISPFLDHYRKQNYFSTFKHWQYCKRDSGKLRTQRPNAHESKHQPNKNIAGTIAYSSTVILEQLQNAVWVSQPTVLRYSSFLRKSTPNLGLENTKITACCYNPAPYEVLVWDKDMDEVQFMESDASAANWNSKKSKLGKNT